MPVISAATHTERFRLDGFRRFAWGVLAYNVLVVLWGGYVRASGSGAGCGSHWPLCNGEVVPLAPTIERVIEFTHRLSSGLALLAVVALVWWSLRALPTGHRARRTAAWSLVFLFTEALLGAGLVLFQYVGKDASAGRALYLSAHLANTQLLLGMLAATAWFAGQPRKPTVARPRALIIALAVALVAGISGAIAALGDTLYPAASLASGISSEFSGGAPVLLRLRMLHPAIALAAAVYLVMAGTLAMGRNPSASVSTAGRAMLALVFVQLAVGILNWVLLAPISMQIVHLLIADLVWIALVILFLAAREDSAVTPAAVRS